MAEACDFKKVGTKGYKAWRILSASGQWVTVYNKRVKMLQSYRSGIIFPEQMLGLNQGSIYKVAVSRSGSTINSQIIAMASFLLSTKAGEPLDSLEKILEFEAAEYGNIAVGGFRQDSTFHNNAFFSNVKDAVKYQQDAQAVHLSQIG